MEEKELILKLKQLQEIKPRKEWAFLLKNRIINSPVSYGVENKTSYKELFSNVFSVLFRKNFAYSFAMLLLMVSVLGFMNYDLSDKTNSGLGQNPPTTLIKSNIETFKAKSQNLAQTVKNKPQQPKDVSLAVKETKDAAKELTEEIQKNPDLAKAVALDVNNNKTYLDILEGDDLKEASDTLYRAIDEQMIKDLEKTTLTQEQKDIFDEVKNLYNQEKYSEALEKILVINVKPVS